jgi:hypothetical protein
MIHANCRIRLTADDFDFIVRTLSLKPSDRVSLERLLTDEDTRDTILDHEALAAAVIESPGRLKISPQLLFYVLCRKVLRDTSVKSRDAADYVASLLEGFSRTARVYSAPGGGEKNPMRYISDMLPLLSKASDREAFFLRAHIANYALFVSGMFAENVEKRSERGAPDLSFYEKMGRMNYRVAAEYREAQKFNLISVYDELSRGFHEARLALNELASRLLHLDAAPPLPILG